MHDTLDYARALAEARSCLVALADSTTDVDQSSHFDRLLIHLDEITGDVGPAAYPLGEDHAALIFRLEAAFDRMIEFGCSDIGLGLLLAAALMEDWPRAPG